MPEPDPAGIMTFATPKDLGLWLKVNHATESELWVKIFKKKTGIPNVTWDDVVTETLCWGWIDGVKKSIDDQAYLQRVTPRKARSNWSRRNREHAERLISEGRMTESGLVHIRAAKADGRWENAYAASEMKVPADFLAALESKPKASKIRLKRAVKLYREQGPQGFYTPRNRRGPAVLTPSILADAQQLFDEGLETAWVRLIGLHPSDFRTHSLRRTDAC